LLAAGLSLSGPARAQASGFALDRFDPSDRGSDWFVLDSLDMRGKLRPALGVVGDYGYLPLAIYNGDGTLRSKLVEDQLFLHVGAALVFLDRFRVALNLPLALVQNGQGGALDGVSYAGPSGFAVGDLRADADVRLAGAYGDPFRVGIGVQVFVPVGSRSDFTSDGSTRVQPRLNVAGDVGVFAYAAQVAFQYRGLDSSYAGTPLGSQVSFGGAVGLHTSNRVLWIGPEVYGATTVSSSDAIFKKTTTPLEALLGVHLRIASDWHAGIGGGGGLTRGFGSPAARAVALLEWSPDIRKPPPPDRDGDGVLDADDACPDVKGIPTDDPKTNGCPPDRDADGVLDADDACPDVKGIRTDDPKTNGCPPDRDADGVLDADDACPDVKGIRTDDPKTNGCPPDRDSDGVLDADDACPDVAGERTDDPKTNGCPPDPDPDKDGIPSAEDACPNEAGPKNADPQKNGCPQAVVRNDRIVILDQVRFKINSAIILPESEALMRAILKVFVDHPEIAKVSVEGHTDNRGPASYNKELSSRRAASVVHWLVAHGVAAGRLTSIGYGMERPLDSNEAEEGRQKNRRVELHILDR
jgi:outer membrane protein OmpA-like peptidoglycan-associated protein